MLIAQKAFVPADPRPARVQPLRPVPGAVLAALALGGTTYALIDWGEPLALPPAAVVALASAIGFVVAEGRARADARTSGSSVTGPSGRPTR